MREVGHIDLSDARSGHQVDCWDRSCPGCIKREPVQPSRGLHGAVVEYLAALDAYDADRFGPGWMERFLRRDHALKTLRELCDG